MASRESSIPREIDELVECLEDEYGALLAEDHERLEAVLLRKERLLERLAAQSALLGNPQGDQARAHRPWRQGIDRMRQLNQRNSIVLAPRTAGNNARLRFLQSALGRSNLYAADGSVVPPGPERIPGAYPRGSA